MGQVQTLWYTRCPVPTPLGIASQLGWVKTEFATDGITVRTLQDETDRQLRDSHFDHRLENSFRQGGNIPAIWARASGRNTKVIGLTWTDEAQVILSKAESPIRSVKDLVGKRLGVVVRPDALIDFWRATTVRAYAAALEAHGFSVKDVELVNLERLDPDASGPGWAKEPLLASREALALQQGEVDVIFHKGSRGLELADSLGASIVYDVGAHPDPSVRINNGSPRTLTVDEGLLRDHPQLVVRLLKKVILAGRWAEDHRAETIAYIAKETNSSEQAVERGYGPQVHRHLDTTLTESSVEALSNFTTFLAEWRFIPTNFDVRAWIDPNPLHQALRELQADALASAPDVRRAPNQGDVSNLIQGK